MTAQELALQVKQRRDTLRISQQELADLSGIGVRTIYEIEKGIANPTLEVLNRLADVLGLELQLHLKTIRNL